MQGAPLIPYLLLAMPGAKHSPALTCCPEMLGMKLLSQTSPGAAGSVLCCQNLVTPQFAKLLDSSNVELLHGKTHNSDSTGGLPHVHAQDSGGFFSSAGLIGLQRVYFLHPKCLERP